MVHTDLEPGEAVPDSEQIMRRELSFQLSSRVEEMRNNSAIESLMQREDFRSNGWKMPEIQETPLRPQSSGRPSRGRGQPARPGSQWGSRLASRSPTERPVPRALPLSQPSPSSCQDPPPQAPKQGTKRLKIKLMGKEVLPGTNWDSAGDAPRASAGNDRTSEGNSLAARAPDPNSVEEIVARVKTLGRGMLSPWRLSPLQSPLTENELRQLADEGIQLAMPGPTARVCNGLSDGPSPMPNTAFQSDPAEDAAAVADNLEPMLSPSFPSAPPELADELAGDLEPMLSPGFPSLPPADQDNSPSAAPQEPTSQLSSGNASASGGQVSSAQVQSAGPEEARRSQSPVDDGPAWDESDAPEAAPVGRPGPDAEAGASPSGEEDACVSCPEESGELIPEGRHRSKGPARPDPAHSLPGPHDPLRRSRSPSAISREPRSAAHPVQEDGEIEPGQLPETESHGLEASKAVLPPPEQDSPKDRSAVQEGPHPPTAPDESASVEIGSVGVNRRGRHQGTPPSAEGKETGTGRASGQSSQPIGRRDGRARGSSPEGLRKVLTDRSAEPGEQPSESNNGPVEEPFGQKGGDGDRPQALDAAAVGWESSGAPGDLPQAPSWLGHSGGEKPRETQPCDGPRWRKAEAPGNDGGRDAYQATEGFTADIDDRVGDPDGREGTKAERPVPLGSQDDDKEPWGMQKSRRSRSRSPAPARAEEPSAGPPGACRTQQQGHQDDERRRLPTRKPDPHGSGMDADRERVTEEGRGEGLGAQNGEKRAQGRLKASPPARGEAMPAQDTDNAVHQSGLGMRFTTGDRIPGIDDSPTYDRGPTRRRDPAACDDAPSSSCGAPDAGPKGTPGQRESSEDRRPRRKRKWGPDPWDQLVPFQIRLSLTDEELRAVEEYMRSRERSLMLAQRSSEAPGAAPDDDRGSHRAAGAYGAQRDFLAGSSRDGNEESRPWKARRGSWGRHALGGRGRAGSNAGGPRGDGHPGRGPRGDWRRDSQVSDGSPLPDRRGSTRGPLEEQPRPSGGTPGGQRGRLDGAEPTAQTDRGNSVDREKRRSQDPSPHKGTSSEEWDRSDGQMACIRGFDGRLDQSSPHDARAGSRPGSEEPSARREEKRWGHMRAKGEWPRPAAATQMRTPEAAAPEKDPRTLDRRRANEPPGAEPRTARDGALERPAADGGKGAMPVALPSPSGVEGRAQGQDGTPRRGQPRLPPLPSGTPEKNHNRPHGHDTGTKDRSGQAHKAARKLREEAKAIGKLCHEYFEKHLMSSVYFIIWSASKVNLLDQTVACMMQECRQLQQWRKEIVMQDAFDDKCFFDIALYDTMFHRLAAVARMEILRTSKSQMSKVISTLSSAKAEHQSPAAESQAAPRSQQQNRHEDRALGRAAKPAGGSDTPEANQEAGCDQAESSGHDAKNLLKRSLDLVTAWELVAKSASRLRQRRDEYYASDSTVEKVLAEAASISQDGGIEWQRHLQKAVDRSLKALKDLRAAR
mmetsp:Transcript_6773/g.16304  ORF Transcript_6773/g.16304 Transcript_6773/m.16304 type:complete len:1483 (-) Transcript_6773:293-4741(-)